MSHRLFARPFRVVSLVTTLLCAAAGSASAQATQRPIADFLGPNLAENIGIIWYETGQTQRGYFDYFGRSALANSLTLGSSFTGTVVERELPDGRASVRVVLHARRVFAYVYDAAIGNAIVFGHTGSQIKNGGDPALADVTLTVDFINEAPGAPLPSLTSLVFRPSAAYEIGKLSVVANAAGTFRAAYGVAEGTPGRLHATQRGLYDVPGLPSNGSSVFPVESLKLTVIGQ